MANSHHVNMRHHTPSKPNLVRYSRNSIISNRHYRSAVGMGAKDFRASSTVAPFQKQARATAKTNRDFSTCGLHLTANCIEIAPFEPLTHLNPHGSKGHTVARHFSFSVEVCSTAATSFNNTKKHTARCSLTIPTKCFIRIHT